MTNVLEFNEVEQSVKQDLVSCGIARTWARQNNQKMFDSHEVQQVFQSL